MSRYHPDDQPIQCPCDVEQRPLLSPDDERTESVEDEKRWAEIRAAFIRKWLPHPRLMRKQAGGK